MDKWQEVVNIVIKQYRRMSRADLRIVSKISIVVNEGLMINNM